MLNLTLEQVHSMVEQAKEHGACSHETDDILTFTDVNELLKNKNAPYWLSWYACHVIKDRWPEGEDIIKTSPERAYRYARDVIKGRWPEAEEIIRTDPICAYRYACNVIKGRWPEAEEIIKNDSGCAFCYALNVESKEIIEN